ncbi:MAG: hypothetical protein VB050_14160 [Geobacteraceae bacterium]|nr:hypothetical protein [Geobacteraceae bacterium]
MPAGFGRGGGPWWRRFLGRGGMTVTGKGRPDFCICPECGFVVSKQPGNPCFLTPCPRCGARMARKFVSGE